MSVFRMQNIRSNSFDPSSESDCAAPCNDSELPASYQLRQPSTTFSIGGYTPPSSFEARDKTVLFPSYEDTSRASTKYDYDVDGEFEVEHLEYPRTRGSVSFAAEPMYFSLRIPPSPGLVERPEDDTAAREQPERHVDYLSHEWIEEDLWSSFKFVRSKRNVYPNSARLENASWRKWEQKRRGLKTVSAETLEWLKDHDVTWLYGPLQPGTPMPSSGTRTASDSDIKPCLKKRSLSELMLQRSISTASLLRQATAAQMERRDSHHAHTPSLTRASTSPSSLASSDAGSPPPGRSSSPSKNVRFHEKVEQCRSLAHFGEDEPEYHYISDSDSSAVSPRSSPKPRGRSTVPSKTIEKLPHAPLKSPEPEEVKVSPRWSQLPPPNAKLPNRSHHRKDSVELFQDKLDVININATNPSLGLATPSFFAHPSLPGSARPQLPPFSFSFPAESSADEDSSTWSADIDFAPFDMGEEEQDVTSDSDNSDYEVLPAFSTLGPAKTALVNRVMQEFWVQFNAKDYSREPVSIHESSSNTYPDDWASRKRTSSPNAQALAAHEQSLRQTLPLFVRKRVEGLVASEDSPEESSIMAGLAAIIQDCQTKVLSAYEQDEYGFSRCDRDNSAYEEGYTESSPMSMCSDSGYGSEKRYGCSEKERVREVREVEVEKGVKDWEVYRSAWEDDEAESAAWENSF